MTTMPTRSPFQWGQGGRKLSGDDISMQRRMAMQNLAGGADYSPVQSPWQGLARVGQGLLGGLQMRQAGEAEERLATDAATKRQEVIAALGLDPGIAGALDEKGLSSVAQAMWESQQPKAFEPGNDFERALVGQGLQPGTPEWVAANQTRVTNINDPLSQITTPDGSYILPRSKLLSMGGGDQASGATPGGLPPETLPADFDFGTERSGGTGRPPPQTITPQGINQLVTRYGPAETERMLRSGAYRIVDQGGPASAPGGFPEPMISGNLPLDVRYRVPNADGSISTVRTMSIGTDDGEVLIPTVINGRVVSDDEAIDHYFNTGENFGTFRTPDEATAYADWLHRQHEQQMGGR